MRPKTIACDGCEGAEVPIADTTDLNGILHHAFEVQHLPGTHGQVRTRTHPVRNSDIPKPPEPLPDGHPFKDESHLEAHMRLSRELAELRERIEQLERDRPQGL
jgi:hypothetical protein